MAQPEACSVQADTLTECGACFDRTSPSLIGKSASKAEASKRKQGKDKKGPSGGAKRRRAK